MSLDVHTLTLFQFIDGDTSGTLSYSKFSKLIRIAQLNQNAKISIGLYFNTRKNYIFHAISIVFEYSFGLVFRNFDRIDTNHFQNLDLALKF